MNLETQSNISLVMEQLKPLLQSAVIGLPIGETQMYTLNSEKIEEALDLVKQYEGQEGYINLLESLSHEISEVITIFLTKTRELGKVRGFDTKAWIALTRAHLRTLTEFQDSLIADMAKYGNTDMYEAEEARLFAEQIAAYTSLYTSELEELLTIPVDGNALAIDAESLYLWAISLLGNSAATNSTVLREEKLAVASNLISVARVKLQELKSQAQNSADSQAIAAHLDRIDSRLEQLYTMYAPSMDDSTFEAAA